MQDTVRVLRIYSFEGPRDLIERQLKNSLPDGEKSFDKNGCISIKVATLGTFPEILTPATNIESTELAMASVLLDQLLVPTNRDEPGDPADSAMTLTERIKWLGRERNGS